MKRHCATVHLARQEISMEDKDEKIEYYWSLKPARFPTLGKLELRQQFEEGANQDLTLELLPSEPQHEGHMVLAFTGIRELRFVPGTWSIVPVHLDFIPIPDRQWEHVHYRVLDYENLDFSFYCDDFTVRLEGFE